MSLPAEQLPVEQGHALSLEQRRRELITAKRRLTPKQRLVLNALPKHLSVWQAAESVGIGSSTVHRWLQKGKDFAFARELIEQQALEQVGITHFRVLREAAAIAFSDPRKMFNADGSLKGVHELDDETAAAIAAIEVEEIGVGKNGEAPAIARLHKIKRWDKQRALELLARYQKMIGDDQRLQAPDGPGLTVIVQQAGGTQVGVHAAQGAHGRVVVQLPEPE